MKKIKTLSLDLLCKIFKNNEKITKTNIWLWCESFYNIWRNFFFLLLLLFSLYTIWDDKYGIKITVYILKCFSMTQDPDSESCIFVEFFFHFSDVCRIEKTVELVLGDVMLKSFHFSSHKCLVLINLIFNYKNCVNSRC